MAYPVLQSRDDLLAILVQLADSRERILVACRALTPAELDDPIIPGTWTLLENLAHLAWAEAAMLAWIQHRPEILPRDQFPPEPAPQLDSLPTALDEAHAAAIAFLKSHPESVLAEPCRYGHNARLETVGGVFFHLIEHEIHHRAFILWKLRTLRGG